MATTVIAPRPAPVSSRAASSVGVSHAKALSSEHTEYQSTDTIRGAAAAEPVGQPPAPAAPTNMPRKRPR